MRKYPARFAPVGPLPLIRSIWDANPKNHSQHGSYHLILAHDVLKAENMLPYELHFRQVREFFGSDTLLIMDNSIVELGNAVDMKVVAQAGELVGADVLVLPDVMGDGPKTRLRFLDDIRKIQKKPLGNFDLMAVPQGPTLQDFAACLEVFADFEEVTWIGIPRIATQQLGSRHKLIQLARAINPDWSLHLLGFSDDVVDDVLCANLGHIEGIDSAVPIRAGQKGIRFNLANSDYGKRGDYWESTEHTAAAIENIEYVRDLIGEGR